jgi:hypothetical protein
MVVDDLMDMPVIGESIPFLFQANICHCPKQIPQAISIQLGMSKHYYIYVLLIRPRYTICTYLDTKIVLHPFQIISCFDFFFFCCESFQGILPIDLNEP